jgi:lambda family phage portal protein
MDIIAAITRYFGPGKPPAPNPAPRLRSFSGGTPSRLTAGFIASNTSIDADIHAGLETLRARSRALSQNNPYAAKFLNMMSANVVGHAGFTLQARSSDTRITAGKVLTTPDGMANRAIEAAFAKWSAKGICDITGRHSFKGLCRLLVRTYGSDGEYLVRRIRGATANSFGYALQALDIDRLDVNYNARHSNGNIIRMSVEIDSYGRPVAYWLRTSHPGENAPANQAGATRERIPAEDIFHGFVSQRPEQRRGVPPMHAAIEALYHLGELNQSALVAARKGADTLGFFVSPDGTPPNDDAPDAPIEISAAGTWDTLPEGYDLRQYNSAFPSEVYGIFHKDCLRSVSSGLNVAYNGLGNDLEGVNFSSIRAGMLEEREAWMDLQEWFIEGFLIPVFNDWLKMSLANGAITMENGSALPATKFDKFAAHTWQGRRWPWVDPLKDIDASIAAIDAGLDSPQRIAATQGRDIEDVLDDIAAFQQMVRDKNVTLPSKAPNPVAKIAAPDPVQ